MNTSISREELRTRLASASRPVLVEALPEKYYVAKHLPGALHLPHDQVDTLAANVLPKKSAQIVVYCANSQYQDSHIAAHRLSVMGYTNVSVYPAASKIGKKPVCRSNQPPIPPS